MAKPFAGVCVLVLLSAGCSGGGATRAATRPATPSAAAAAFPPCAALSTIPSGSLWTIARGLNEPDDVLSAGGSLYLSVLGSGQVQVLAPGKPTITLPLHIGAVEGTIFIGRDYYAAGQADDAVYRVSGSRLTKVIQFRPVAGQDGVDGISAQGGQLIVPDSPRGVVDWVNPATGAITRQVGGFSRPTGAWPLADGSVLIADEYGNAAVRVAPDGSKTYLVRNLAIVDDVAQDSQGAVFVVTPAAAGGRLVQILSGGTTHDLADHLAAPQGLAVDRADNLYFTEEDGGRLDLLVRTFKLVTLPQVSTSSTTPVCVQVARAAGFAAAVTLTGSAGLQVVAQPGSGSQGAVLVAGCAASPCELTASSGSRRDVMWVSSRA